MDASVQRVQPEPVVTGPRPPPRAPERRKRGGGRRGEAEPQFLLEPQPASAHAGHVEPHSPKGDGLGEKLDVIA